MSIDFLGLKINPSKVSALKFSAKHVDLSDDDKSLMESSPSGKVYRNPKKSNLKIHFVMGGGSADLHKPDVASCVYEDDCPDYMRKFLCDVSMHSETINAIAQEFNRCAIKAGYPVSIKPEPLNGTIDLGYHPIHNFRAANEALSTAIHESDDESYPAEYYDAYAILKDKLHAVIESCICASQFLVGIDPESNYVAQNTRHSLCRFGINYASQALNDFASSIPASEKGIHSAASELAICFVEFWIIAGLYFPLEDTRDLFPAIDN
jgi:hypothetical protein